MKRMVQSKKNLAISVFALIMPLTFVAIYPAIIFAAPQQNCNCQTINCGCGQADCVEACQSCPQCHNDDCCLQIKKVCEENSCYKTEQKVVCVPKIQWPWEKDCPPIRSQSRTVNVLKKHIYKCERCAYEWSPNEPGAGERDITSPADIVPQPYGRTPTIPNQGDVTGYPNNILPRPPAYDPAFALPQPPANPMLEGYAPENYSPITVSPAAPPKNVSPLVAPPMNHPSASSLPPANSPMVAPQLPTPAPPMNQPMRANSPLTTPSANPIGSDPTLVGPPTNIPNRQPLNAGPPARKPNPRLMHGPVAPTKNHPPKSSLPMANSTMPSPYLPTPTPPTNWPTSPSYLRIPAPPMNQPMRVNSPITTLPANPIGSDPSVAGPPTNIPNRQPQPLNAAPPPRKPNSHVMHGRKAPAGIGIGGNTTNPGARFGPSSRSPVGRPVGPFIGPKTEPTLAQPPARINEQSVAAPNLPNTAIAPLPPPAVAGNRNVSRDTSPPPREPERVPHQTVPPAKSRVIEFPEFPQDVYPPFAEPFHEGARRAPAPMRYRPFVRRQVRRPMPIPSQTTSKPVANPVAQPTVKSTAKPIGEPVANAAGKPNNKPVANQFLLSSRPVLATFSDADDRSAVQHAVNEQPATDPPTKSSEWIRLSDQ